MDKMCAQLDYTLRLKSKTEMNRKKIRKLCKCDQNTEMSVFCI